MTLLAYLMNFKSIFDTFLEYNSLILIVPLLGTGLYLTIRLMFIQIRYLTYAIRIALGFADREEDQLREANEVQTEREGDIGYFQALTTALSATVGTGNIIGVAGTVLVGGPGALFWMWITAWVGMATKYGEAVLAVKYREKTEAGYAGGPMYYIQKALKIRWMAGLFAVLTVIAALGIGNVIQSNAAVANLASAPTNVPNYISSAIIALLVGLVILGGVKRIGEVAGFLVPFMAILYIGGCITILALQYKLILPALSRIMHYAFNSISVASGTLSGLIMLAIQKGVSGSLFSNEAGLGSAPIVAASAKTDFSVKQGLVSMLGPFFDTVIICVLTGLVVVIGIESGGLGLIENLVNGGGAEGAKLKPMLNEFQTHYNSIAAKNTWLSINEIFNSNKIAGTNALALQNTLTAHLFSLNLGLVGKVIVQAAVVLFSVSTLLGWYFYSDRALVYLGAMKMIPAYKVLWVVAIFVGGMVPDSKLIWNLAGFFNSLMAYPNLVALLALSPIITNETKQFFKRYPHRHDLAIRFYVIILKLLPKNIISKIFGFLAGLQLPRFIMIPVLLAFSRIYNINAQEARLELKDYSSLNEFFTRALKNGVRIVEPDAKLVVSPVDGTLLNSGDLDKGTVVQTKGIESKLQDLLGSNTYYDRFLGGKYATIYLAPKDYHRIHSPCAGVIQGYYYQPGKLFPVNEIAVETINRLFSRNERLITYIETQYGLVAMVKVGATGVGKIRVTYDENLSTNRWFRISKEHFYEDGKNIAKGDEIGRFEMGSTVMLLFEKNSVDLFDIEEKQKLFFGQPIGTFRKPKAKPSKPNKGESK